MKKAFTLLIAVCFVFAFAALAFAGPPITSTQQNEPTSTVFIVGQPIDSASGIYDLLTMDQKIIATRIDLQTGRQNEPAEAYKGGIALIASVEGNGIEGLMMAKTGGAAYAADLV